MDVSQKWGYPEIIHFDGMFCWKHLETIIFGYQFQMIYQQNQRCDKAVEARMLLVS